MAEHMPGRLAKQCRERYLNNLDPDLRRGAWSREVRIEADAGAPRVGRECSVGSDDGVEAADDGPGKDTRAIDWVRTCCGDGCWCSEACEGGGWGTEGRETRRCPGLVSDVMPARVAPLQGGSGSITGVILEWWTGVGHNVEACAVHGGNRSARSEMLQGCARSR